MAVTPFPWSDVYGKFLNLVSPKGFKHTHVTLSAASTLPNKFIEWLPLNS